MQIAHDAAEVAKTCAAIAVAEDYSPFAFGEGKIVSAKRQAVKGAESFKLAGLGFEPVAALIINMSDSFKLLLTGRTSLNPLHKLGQNV